MRIESITKEDFGIAVSNHPDDAFALRYFIPHATKDELWGTTYGAYKNGLLAGAIALRERPNYFNIKLLHTFAAHRKQGVARALCDWAVAKAYCAGKKYFRVAANPNAFAFYRAVGFKIRGIQRSGCGLVAFRIGGPEIKHAIYEEDEQIRQWVHAKQMGGCVKVFPEPC